MTSNLFQPADAAHAYLKGGLLGLAGSGKTLTSSLIAVGLIGYIEKRGVAVKKKAAFVDTENGASWVIPRFKDAGIELVVARTRALTDLRDAIKWATDNADVLIVDSITHFWRIYCDEYAVKRNRKRGLEFSDWNEVKREWRLNFTDLYLNSPLHIIMCGRQGYEYDMQENDAGKKELVKTAVKMKAEGETGFEPSLLIQMEQEQRLEKGSVVGIDHVATVLKDRSDALDGKMFKNPTFDNFLPHIERLAIGTAGVAIDTGRDNSSLFTSDGDDNWAHERRQRDIWCEEIEGLLVKHWPGATVEAKAKKASLIESVFQTRSWTKVQGLQSEFIKDGYETLRVMLEPPIRNAQEIDVEADVPEAKKDAA